EAGVITDTFTSSVNRSGGKVDIVWIIDNSGSMNTEAAHVRTNLLSFLNSTSNYADLKFKLVSKQGNSGNSAQLPFPADEQFSQINQEIDSYSSLSKLQTLIDAGKFDGFFRPDSLKYLVL